MRNLKFRKYNLKIKTCLRYEGHRPKQTRRRDHGRPSPPRARHPGNAQDATAPMPTSQSDWDTTPEN